MKWYNTDKKLPKRTDYVLITNENVVSLAIYDTQNKIFIDLVKRKDDVTPEWWAYVPIPRHSKFKLRKNWRGIDIT